MRRQGGVAPLLASLILVSISIMACIILSIWMTMLSSDMSMVAQATTHIPRILILGAYLNKSNDSILVFSLHGGPRGKFIICADAAGRIAFYEGTDQGWIPRYVGGGVYLYVIRLKRYLSSGVYYCKLLLGDGELIIFKLVVY